MKEKTEAGKANCRLDLELFGKRIAPEHRMSVGCVNLKGLRPGEYRRLKPQEVKDLKKLVGK